jgi:hypothetical protein
VHFAAADCKNSLTCNILRPHGLCDNLRSLATRCKIAKNRLKIRRPLRSWGFAPLPAPKLNSFIFSNLQNCEIVCAQNVPKMCPECAQAPLSGITESTTISAEVYVSINGADAERRSGRGVCRLVARHSAHGTTSNMIASHSFPAGCNRSHTGHGEI